VSSRRENQLALFSGPDACFGNARNGLVFDGYTLLHLSLGANLSKCLQVGLAARNLLNTSYIPELSLLKNIGVVEPGRNISLRLNLTL
jgi:outer membrane receptor protein involved in Fe transport